MLKVKQAFRENSSKILQLREEQTDRQNNSYRVLTTIIQIWLETVDDKAVSLSYERTQVIVSIRIYFILVNRAEANDRVPDRGFGHACLVDQACYRSRVEGSRKFDRRFMYVPLEVVLFNSF